MELVEAMRTTGTCRYFSDEPVPDDVLYKAFDCGALRPAGRQPPAGALDRRARPGQEAAAGRALPPVLGRVLQRHRGRRGQRRRPARDGHQRRPLRPPPRRAPRRSSSLCAEIEGLHVTDADLDRVSVVGGGSIYPTVQNFCLALRDQGVGSAVTTLLCHEEPKVRELLHIPDGFLTAATSRSATRPRASRRSSRGRRSRRSSASTTSPPRCSR